MRPDRPDGLMVSSTMSGEEIGMTFDENSLVHLMSVLTDLYSDPPAAIIREYSTNAFDSHVEAGQTRPIEVETPNPLSPSFRVKDYGVGLSAEDIRNIYSKYGASTKRDSDEQVGMLGLGCKAALTYSTQFTLTGVKDGIKTVVSISRDEEGAGTMTVVNESKTNEPNGVEVIVPTKKHDNLKQKAESFFSFWPRGSVLLNGEEPKRIDGLWLRDDLLMLDDEHSYIVMGNVPYPIERDRLTDLPFSVYDYGIAAFVPVGAVNFVPSREALQYTRKTVAAIEEATRATRELLKVRIQEDIDAEPTPADGLRKAQELSRRMLTPNFRRFTYKGREFPAYVWDDEPTIVVPRRNWSKKTKHVTGSRLGLGDLADTIFFHGFEGRWTPTRRKKLDRWRADTDSSAHDYVFVPYKIPSPWIKDEQWFDWRTIDQIRLPREALFDSDRIPGSYDVIKHRKVKNARGEWAWSYHYENGIAGDEVAKEKRIFFFVGSRAEAAYNIVLLMKVLRANWTIVYFGSNRLAKFQRLFPQAQNLNDYLWGRYHQWWKGLRKLDRDALLVRSRAGGNAVLALSSLDYKRFRDPNLRSAVRTINHDLSKTKQTFDLFRNHLGELDIPRVPVRLEQLLNEYPLLYARSMYAVNSRLSLDHVYIYANAVYQETR